MRQIPLIALLTLGSIAACSDPELVGTNDFLQIAKGGLPSGWVSQDAEFAAFYPAPPGWLRVRQTIAPVAWEEDMLEDVYRTKLSLPGSGLPPDRVGPHELRSGDFELEQRVFSAALLDLGSLPDGSFVVLGQDLLLLDREGRFYTKEMEYYSWIERGDREEGRVHLPGATGDGILLAPGERLTLDLPAVGSTAGAVLQFTAMAYGSEFAQGTTTLEVEVDGAVVYNEEVINRLSVRGHAVRIPLPEYSGGEVVFRAPTGEGFALFLDPVLVPADSSEYFDSELPDIVIFLADTFRADNLEAWGGDPQTTPHMNAFARKSWAFLKTHSPAPWTLPSQASLFSGVYPLQHGVTSNDYSLPSGLPTMARHFHQAGYRTVAITESVLVSERYGLDQGFEMFLEESGTKSFRFSTLERVQGVLDADDGRPLLLFVQSYRTHAPYFASPETISSLPGLFGKNADPKEWEYEAVLQVLEQ